MLLASKAMDAAQALADLTEISSQIEAAVLFDEGGAVLGSTLANDEAAQGVARAAGQLLERAGGFRSEGSITQLEASTADGSVFVVRDEARRIAATTGPAPTVGLVFYDLKSALRNADAEPAKPKRTRRKKADDEA
jgi:predicted regulator of Ras-like GTPase activity (Roadblock/LC7/MglB family)